MRIVMTGAPAGIGLSAAQLLLAAPATEMVVGARTPHSLAPALRGRASVLPLDLASFGSVHAFADALGDPATIDVLLLNAGMQTVRPRTSAEGL